MACTTFTAWALALIFHSRSGVLFGQTFVSFYILHSRELAGETNSYNSSSPMLELGLWVQF